MFKYSDRELPSDDLLRGAIVVWDNLPVFVATGAAAAALWSLGRSTGLLLPLAFAGVLPLLTALTNGFNRLMQGERFRLRNLVRCLPHSALVTWKLLWPSTLALSLAAVANAMWLSTGETWILLSFGASLATALASGALGITAVPIAIATTRSAREAWQDATRVVLRNPTGGLRGPAAFILAGWASQHLSFALLLLLPVPLVGLWSASATRTNVQTS
ncbi:hypothetical protein [Kribbella swartbergensis]